MSRTSHRLAFALFALSLLPGLVLGRSGILPCPHMAMGVDMGMGTGMPMSHGVGAGMAMGHGGGDQDGASPMAHGRASQGGGDPARPPLGHMPCTCAGGCPGASAAEARPVAAVTFTITDQWTVLAAFAAPRTYVPSLSPYLLPFPLGPPSST